MAAREAVRDEAGAAFVVLAISGASFLYHQVRSMVGAVVAVVRGARSEAWLGRVLLPPRRSRAEPRRVEAAIDKATIAAVPPELPSGYDHDRERNPGKAKGKAGSPGRGSP